MLQGIRDRAHGWIAWIIIVLIVIPFALWGIQKYLGVDPNVPVAKVNGDEIPLSEFQRAYQRTQAALAGRDPGPARDEILKSATVDSLIEERLLGQFTEAEGLRISDEQVAHAIDRNPAFKTAGAFSQTQYNRFLARNGYSPGAFEETLRRNLLQEQLSSGFVRAAIATDREVGRLRSLQAQRRTFSEVVIDPGDAAEVPAPEVSEAEIRQYFDSHRAEFVTKERVKLAYLRMARDDLAKGVEVDDDALHNLYENRIASFRTPEQRRVRHILVAVGKKDDPSAVAAARAKIAGIRSKILAGADFGALAKETSDDPGSAKKSGDLGFIAHGLMDPAFEQAAFSLDKGVLSDPIRSAFGFHLIEVTDIRPGHTKTFEEARPDLEQEYRRQQAEQRYYDQAEQLSNLVFEQPDNLDVAAETLGLAIETSPWLTKEGIAGDPLFSNQKVLSASFSPDVEAEGNNSEPLEVDGPALVVVRVAEKRPSAQQSFEEVKEAIGRRLERKAAERAAAEIGKRLLARLRAGEAPDAVVKGAHLSWAKAKQVSRSDFSIPEPVRLALFRMKKPGPEQSEYDAAVDGKGNFRILRLLAVESPPVEAHPADRNTVKNARRALARLEGQEDYRAMLATLRNGADVTVFSDRF